MRTSARALQLVARQGQDGGAGAGGGSSSGGNQSPGTGTVPGGNVSSTQTTSTSSSSATSSTTMPSQSDHGTTDSKASTIIPIAIIVGLLVISVLVFAFLRRARKRHPNPKYIPTPTLKKLWTRWSPNSRSRTYHDASGLESLSSNAQSRHQAQGSSFAGSANSAANIAANNTIDRNTSVRSVMTLPAYNPNAGATERVLGREGERGGIDTVVEFPEGEDEAEELRDEEMEALYQVRLARRTQVAEREERERLRAEARERGDVTALRNLRSSRNSGPTSVEAARAVHEAVKSRERTISSVSYADLGIARHDGTRVRANSEESERPLLGDAGSIAESRRLSGTTTYTLGNHGRNGSNHSLYSTVSRDDMIASGGDLGDLPPPRMPGATRSRANSGSSLRQSFTSVSARSQNMSSPEMIEHDDHPHHEPPEYVNVDLDGGSPIGAPPEYFSPIDREGQSLPTPVTSGSVRAWRGRTDLNEVERGERLRRAEQAEEAERASELERAERAERADQLLRSGQPMSSPEIVSPVSATSGTSTPESDSSSRSGRGVGGVPQLPSLRLGNLPSISIHEPSPIGRSRRISEEFS